MNEKCPNCGYCQHCGRSGGYQFVPYTAPYYVPYMPTYPNWTAPNFTVTGLTPSNVGIAPATFD